MRVSWRVKEELKQFFSFLQFPYPLLEGHNLKRYFQAQLNKHLIQNSTVLELFVVLLRKNIANFYFAKLPSRVWIIFRCYMLCWCVFCQVSLRKVTKNYEQYSAVLLMLKGNSWKPVVYERLFVLEEYVKYVISNKRDNIMADHNMRVLLL